MANINERLTKLETQTEENGKTIWRVFEALYGNGKPGLITEVQKLRLTCEEHLKDHAKRKLDWQWIITALIAIGGIVAAVLK